MNTDYLPARQPVGEAVVCACLQRAEAEISDAVARLGLDTFEEVAAAVLTGSGCTTCRSEIETILETTLRAVPEEIQAIPQEGEPGNRPGTVRRTSTASRQVRPPEGGRTS